MEVVEEMDVLLVGMICTGQLAFNLLENKCFRKLLDRAVDLALNHGSKYLLPHRTKFGYKLTEIASRIRETVCRFRAVISSFLIRHMSGGR